MPHRSARPRAFEALSSDAKCIYASTSTPSSFYVIDFNGDGADDHTDRDVDDEASLLAGNKHPPEYYLKSLQQFDDSVFTSEDYSPGTTLLLGGVEKQWNQ